MRLGVVYNCRMGVKYNVNEKFFDSWNTRMAYILGYLYADGHILNAPYMRGKYVSVTSIDRDSIERIRDWMASKHTITKRASHWENGKQVAYSGTSRYPLGIFHGFCKRIF
jgi:hypothetical protein